MAMSSRPEFSSWACFFFFRRRRAILSRIRTPINTAKQIKQAVMTAIAMRLKGSVEKNKKKEMKVIIEQSWVNCDLQELF